MAQAHIIVLEVGSTMTKANGFEKQADGSLSHVAQGFSPTTVAEGDVSIGVEGALRELSASFSGETSGAEFFVNSSAAGGLKMSVHGLTLNMTARAGREASLGAGAIVKNVTAGAIFSHDLDELRENPPNLILLAGGVDYGDTETVLANAEKLISLKLDVPLIYAGNVVLQKPIRALAERFGRELWLTENVFPAVDVLNVGPVRRLIHDAFAKHIIHAPGMSKLARYTSTPILPTPGAVLLATEIFAEVAGDTVVIDVGGATTDVHSVTDGSPEFSKRMIEPEPRQKRTVEGDLGVYVNAANVAELDASGVWKAKLGELRAVPESDNERELTRWLCQMAVINAVQRHAGTITEIFTAVGKKTIIKGKDLTAVKWVIGTGGALTRVEGGKEILAHICQGPSTHLLPPLDAQVLLDRNYLFSALGTLARRYPELVKNTMRGLFNESKRMLPDTTP